MDKKLSNTQMLLNKQLYDAVVLGHMGDLEIALETGANPNAKHQYYPLVRASADGYDDVVALLINHGAELEVVDADDYMRTPLFLAARLNREKALTVLLEAGANIEAKDIEGCTPLLSAAENGALTSVKLLLAYGADISAKDQNGCDAIKLAWMSNFMNVVELLKSDYPKNCYEKLKLDSLVSVENNLSKGLEF